jgi:preprotein translocase subunit SecE
MILGGHCRRPQSPGRLFSSLFPNVDFLSRLAYDEIEMPRGAFFIDKTTKMNLQNYIKETKVELKHVTWPSKEQTVNFTIIVIGLSVFVGVLLGVFDFIFTGLLKMFIFS